MARNVLTGLAQDNGRAKGDGAGKKLAPGRLQVGPEGRVVGIDMLAESGFMSLRGQRVGLQYFFNKKIAKK